MKKAIIIIGILGVLGYVVFNQFSSKQNNTPEIKSPVVEEHKEILPEEISEAPRKDEYQDLGVRIPTRYVCVGEFCDGSGETDNLDERTTTTIKIPLVKQGGNIGCGVDIFYSAQAVPKTKAVLDASYRLLFDLKALPEIEADGFWNTLASYDQLHYIKSVIDNGVAKIYLGGTMYGPGHCSIPEVRAQITKTALQFDSVKKVEVYLNGTIYNWCAQDQSDGEGSCPETPDYWIAEK